MSYDATSTDVRQAIRVRAIANLHKCEEPERFARRTTDSPHMRVSRSHHGKPSLDTIEGNSEEYFG